MDFAEADLTMSKIHGLSSVVYKKGEPCAKKEKKKGNLSKVFNEVSESILTAHFDESKAQQDLEKEVERLKENVMNERSGLLISRSRLKLSPKLVMKNKANTKC